LELTLGIMLAVLGAALLHAAWNAMLKGGSDTMLDMALVVAGGGLVVAPMLALVPLPAPARVPTPTMMASPAPRSSSPKRPASSASWWPLPAKAMAPVDAVKKLADLAEELART